MAITTETEQQTTEGVMLYGGIENEPDNNIGIYFDVITNHSINISNNITDNYLENNTAIQDTIAHAPIECTLNGMISELVYVPSTNNTRFLRRVYDALNSEKIDLKKIAQKDYNLSDAYKDYVRTDKLSTIGQLLPPVDNYTQLAKNAVVYIEESINRYNKIYKNLTRNVNEKTKLEKVYDVLLDLRDTNTPLIVTTPFATLYNMQIQNIELNQANENHIATISISLKQVNYSDIEITEADQDVLAKYAIYERSQIENNGKADGVMANKDSIISNWFPNADAYILKQ